MKSFSLSILAVDQVCYQGSAIACSVRSVTGWRTFEAHHEPFVSVLVSGVVSVLEEGGGRFSLEIQDGLVRFESNSCLLLVTTSGSD